MSEDRDHVWLDALAGRPAGDSIDTREARDLRRGILARVAEPEAPIAQHDPAREDALIERARREGLIAAGSSTPVSWFGWRGAFAAAAIVCTVAVGLWMRPSSAPETVRGALDGVVRIEAPDPLVLQHELIGQLRAAGVEVTGYEMLGRLGLDADLPQPIPEQVRRILERRSIPLPADGVLRVEITAPAKD